MVGSTQAMLWQMVTGTKLIRYVLAVFVVVIIGGCENRSPEQLLNENLRKLALFTKQGNTQLANVALENALIQIDKEIETQGLSVRLGQIKAELLIKKEDFNAASEVYRSLISQFPDNPDLRIALSKIYLRQDKLDEASQLMAGLADIDSESEALRFAEISFLTQTGQHLVAIDRLRELQKTNPQNLSYSLNLAELHLNQGEIVKARQGFVSLMDKAYELFKDAPYNEQEDTRDIFSIAAAHLASLSLQVGEVDKASELLSRALAHNQPHPRVLFLKATISAQQGVLPSAIDDLEAALKKEPNFTQAREFLAGLYFQTQAYQESEKHYEVLNKNTILSQNALLNYADSLLKLGSSKQAFALLEKAHSESPDDLALKDRYVRAAIATEHYEEALSGIDVLLTNSPQKHRLLAAKGLVYEKMEQPAEAISAFEKAFAYAPEDKQLAERLAQLYLNNDAVEQGIRYFNTTSEGGKHVVAGLSEANLYFHLGEYDNVESAFHSLAKSNPQSAQVYIAWSNLHLKQNDFDSAQAVINQGLPLVANKITLLLFQAQAFEKQVDYGQAIKAYKEVLSIDANVQIALNNYIHLAVNEDGSKQALAQAKSYSSKLKDTKNPMIQDTLAWLHFKLDDYELAARYAQEAADAGIGVPEVYYHLGMIQLKRERENLARIAFRQALELDKDFAQAEKELDKLKAINGFL